LNRLVIGVHGRSGDSHIRSSKEASMMAGHPTCILESAVQGKCKLLKEERVVVKLVFSATHEATE